MDPANTPSGSSDFSDHMLFSTADSIYPEEHPPDATISVVFNPSLRIDGRLPDIILISSDSVYFFVHRHRLLSASYNAFNGHLSELLLLTRGPPPTVRLPDGGNVLNIVLHTAYGLSCTHFHPAFDTVTAALPALLTYGVPLDTPADPPPLLGVPLSPATPLSPGDVGSPSVVAAAAATASLPPVQQLVLAHAPYRPLAAYALAAQHGLDGAAAGASTHLLTLDLSRVTDADATAMGPVYLKRLFLLHQTRLAALRAALARPPEPAAHACADGAGGGAVAREWALAAAGLVWDATPGISASTLRVSLEAIGHAITCETCRDALRRRIQEVVYSWSLVKPTI